LIQRRRRDALPVTIDSGSSEWGSTMHKRQYTKTELGMVYGMAIGAAIFLVMFAITNDTQWIAALSVGLALGLGIGATMDKNQR
jgi:VIT1/CCC1 family predicted Fe2+/Mn2+ transporter